MNVSFGTVNFGVGASGICSTGMVWALRCLCLTGLGISAYLAWTAINMSPVFGCGGGEIIDCGHVLNSKWSKVMGIPVSVPACGLYASLLAMLTFVRRPGSKALTQLLWNALTAGACMAGLAALWFIGLQIFALKHLCPYCLAVHCCGLILAFLLLRNRFTTMQQKRVVASLSVLGVAVMITVQVMTPEPENFEVIRYDRLATVDENSAMSVEGDEEIFAAPSEVFEAPSEVFEAPGEVFEAPSDVAEVPAEEKNESAKLPAENTQKDSAKAQSSEPVVSSTLLLIVPPRLQMLANLPGFLVQDAAPAENPSPADGPTGEEQTAEEKTSDAAEAATPAATGTTADESAEKKEEPSQPADTKPVDTESGDKLVETAKADEAPPAAPARKVVTVAGNRVTLDVKQWPLLGSQDARYIFVEMFDYTCPHCRNTHFAVKGAFEQYGSDLAIIALPVPLERACNDAAGGGGKPGACELARIAITVWRVNPSKFRDFHDWMFESTRSTASARAHAEKLVGVENFRKEYGSKIPGEYVKRHVDLYKKVGAGAVPKLLFPNSTINGEVNSKETLVRTIERELKDVATRQF